MNNIKSFSFSQDEILSNILHLYAHSETFECDLTYSIGVFYKHLPQPAMKFDKYPQSEDVRPLEEAYNIPDNSLSSIICDLPLLSEVTARKTMQDNWWSVSTSLLQPKKPIKQIWK